jgi:hypothetical protein
MMSAEMLPEVLLKRKAIVYVRQSTQTQVQTNLESQRRQYDLVEAPVLPHVILLPDASRAMLPAPFSPSSDPAFPVERHAVCHRGWQKADV